MEPARAAAAVRREVLSTDPPPPRDAIGGALALAAEVGAWDAACPPAALVTVAAEAGLWAAAEWPREAARDRGDAGAAPAAETLVDACLERGLHRQADTHCRSSPTSAARRASSRRACATARTLSARS